MKSLLRSIQVGSALAGKEINGPHAPALVPLRKAQSLQLLIVPLRHQTGYSYKGGTYHGSKLVNDKNPDLYTKCEKSYAEYKYVEKLVPPVYVPEPPQDPNVQLPSGWVPPRLNRENCTLPYFIPRTRNHMMPIYLIMPVLEQGKVRQTRIRNVQGNIWALEKDITAYLKEKYPKKIITSWVLEYWRAVFIRQDFVNDCKEWALNKGF